MSTATETGVRESGGRLRRLSTGIGAQVRAFVRKPLNVLLLVVIPVVVVESYGAAMSAFPMLPGLEGSSVTAMGRVNGAVYTAAFVAGVLGLFQVVSARQADDRLRICGYSRAELFAVRLATVVLGSLVVTAAALAVLWRTTTPDAPLAAFGALALAAVTYGLIGMVVGAALPRYLEGSLVLVFLVDLDDFLASGMLDLDHWLLSLFPLHYPHQLFRDAVFDGTVQAADVRWGVVYLLVALLVVLAAYVRLTATGGGHR